MHSFRKYCAPAHIYLQPRSIKESAGALYVLWLMGPVFQSNVCLSSSLVVKLLTVLVFTISKSQVFLLKKKQQHFQ